VLVISLTSWPTGARILRGEVLKVKELDYILAARTIGAHHWRVLARHVLPNVVGVIIISATVRVGSNILIEAGLSYLGLGVQPPLASWGNMIAEGTPVFRTAWWVTGVPATAVFITVFGFNVLGEGLRDFLNPREQWAAS
jgi:peptide/nickel transport system permease protein